MVADPIFSVWKSSVSKATVRRVTHPSMYNCYSRFGRLYYTNSASISHMWHIREVTWHIALWWRRYANGRKTIVWTANICHPVFVCVCVCVWAAKSQWSLFCASGRLRNGCATIGISWSANEIEAMSRSKINRISWRTWFFYSDDALYCTVGSSDF
jgi:hypothetical protein